MRAQGVGFKTKRKPGCETTCRDMPGLGTKPFQPDSTSSSDVQHYVLAVTAQHVGKAKGNMCSVARAFVLRCFRCPGAPKTQGTGNLPAPQKQGVPTRRFRANPRMRIALQALFDQSENLVPTFPIYLVV